MTEQRLYTINKEWLVGLKALPLKELLKALAEINPKKDILSKEESEYMIKELERRYELLKHAS